MDGCRGTASAAKCNCTYDSGRRHRFLFAVLFGHHLGQLLLGPVLDRIVHIGVAYVDVYRSLLRLALHGRVVRKLALVSLRAGALLEEGAQHRLGISARFQFLRRDRLEQLGQLLLLLQLLLLFLLLGIGGRGKVMLATTLDLLLYLRNELLLLGSFFVFQPERFVLRKWVNWV